MSTVDNLRAADAVRRGAARGAPLLTASHLDHTFTNPAGEPTRVLADVSLTLHEGEIVALLGRSGSGKSTLLRALAGLIAPTAGEVRYRGRLLTGANPGVAMVFQSFALLPWLTVLDNVELGLRAQGVRAPERRRRAREAIDGVGLDGFERAYPKELSGGMRQRVGFARALVVRPDALLMDEPFSALDVVTADNLRAELLRLWDSGEWPTTAALVVTHNIEEAVQLADRILVLSSRPGRVEAEVPVDLARPRDPEAAAYGHLVRHLHGLLTGRDETAAAVPAPGRDAPTPSPSRCRTGPSATSPSSSRSWPPAEGGPTGPSSPTS